MVNTESVGAAVTVKAGARVRVAIQGDIEEWTIVPHRDADAFRQLVSEESPMGRALIGHRLGQRVVAKTPSGAVGVTILAILQ